jgi:transcriptional regulator with XRE-family HTH domain
MQTLGQAIKKARIDQHLRQRPLYEAAGISQKQLSLIECDHADPKWSTVCKLAGILGLRLDDLTHHPDAPCPASPERSP